MGFALVRQYQKKPVAVEAVQLTRENYEQVMEWMKISVRYSLNADNTLEHLTIPTLEGDHRAKPGDYIIKGVKGEFCPCKPDIFEMTYIPVTKE